MLAKEHRIYPEALERLAAGRLRIEGSRGPSDNSAEAPPRVAQSAGVSAAKTIRRISLRGQEMGRVYANIR